MNYACFSRDVVPDGAPGFHRKRAQIHFRTYDHARIGLRSRSRVAIPPAFTLSPYLWRITILHNGVWSAPQTSGLRAASILRSRHVRRAYDVDGAAMSADLYESDRLAAALSESKQLRAQSADLLEHGRHLQKRLAETLCELTTLSSLWAYQSQELKLIEPLQVGCDGFFWHPILVDSDVGDFFRCEASNVARVLPTGRRGEWIATVNLQGPSDQHRSATFDSKGEAREAVREWLRFIVRRAPFPNSTPAKMTNTNKPYGITS